MAGEASSGGTGPAATITSGISSASCRTRLRYSSPSVGGLLGSAGAAATGRIGRRSSMDLELWRAGAIILLVPGKKRGTTALTARAGMTDAKLHAEFARLYEVVRGNPTSFASWADLLRCTEQVFAARRAPRCPHAPRAARLHDDYERVHGLSQPLPAVLHVLEEVCRPGAKSGGRNQGARGLHRPALPPRVITSDSAPAGPLSPYACMN